MSLLGAAETYALLSVMTMTMFGQNPLGFVMPKRFGQSVVGNQAGQYWSGRGYVSLNEFWIDPNTAMSETWGNINKIGASAFLGWSAFLSDSDSVRSWPDRPSAEQTASLAMSGSKGR